MKKILGIMLVILMFSIAVTASAAGESAVLSIVCDEVVNSGEEFDVYVAITEDSNVAGGNIVVGYDNVLMELVSVKEVDLLKYYEINYNPSEEDSNVKINWGGSTGITKGGNLVKLTFKATTLYTDIDATIEIQSAQLADEQQEAIDVEVEDAIVAITGKDAPIFTAETVLEASPGDIIDVKVRLVPSAFAGGLRFDLVYDNTKLQYVEVVDGMISFSQGSATINPSFKSNTIRANLASTKLVTYAEPLATIKFKVLDTATGSAEISFGTGCRIMDALNKGVKCSGQAVAVQIKTGAQVTVDGETVQTNGKIVLGIDNNNGTYSLPENVLGYYIASASDEIFVDAGEYAVAGGEIITTVNMNVDMLEGAQVRYSGGLDETGKISEGNGLRFIATVDRSAVDESIVAGYGMKIGAEGSDNVATIDAINWQSKDVFSVAITNFGSNNYNRNYTAVPFVKVKYSDGAEKTVYGAEKITRSVYYVATGLLKTGAVDDGYGVGESYGLYDVLNAYVNMVGVRLSMNADGNITARTDGTGAYTGEAFFDVSSVLNEDGSYTITVTPISGNFEYPVKIMKYWDEFVRINNNNSEVRSNISEVTHNENGGVTFKFTIPE